MPKISELPLADFASTMEAPCVLSGVTSKYVPFPGASTTLTLTVAGAEGTTLVATYRKYDKLVIVDISSFTGISTASYLQYASLPTALFPNYTRYIPTMILKNNTATNAIVTLNRNAIIPVSVIGASYSIGQDIYVPGLTLMYFTA